MINFKRIKIENFMSIKEQEIVFDNGIFAFEGKNGEGKTTTVLALLQGLFNKNVKSGSDVIEETYNRITGKPYRIEIEFEKSGSVFLIINDRIKNAIQIFQDNKDISVKGIKNQLKQIENILGYNYQLFSSFYYLSTITLQNVFDVSSDNNLVYRFFDIETLKLIEKKLKQQSREIKTDIKIIDANINSLDKQIKMLNNFQHLDRENLMNKKMLLQDTLLALQSSSDYKKMNVLNPNSRRGVYRLPPTKVFEFCPRRVF
jgi:DNA repair exonuclease SbcCD ATPase subunit